MEIDFFIANSADSDEILHGAAFHLGLQRLPMYHLRVPVCCVALPRGAMGLSAFCDCGIY